MTLDDNVKAAILAFVDEYVPGESAVWLTGSRVRGDARPDSDWDVVAFSPFAPSADRDLFERMHKSPFLLDGGPMELVVTHPRHWDNTSPYITELRALGVRLR